MRIWVPYTVCILGEYLSLLHFAETALLFEDDFDECGVIDGLAAIELGHSQQQSGDKVVHDLVVEVLLVAGGEPTVYRHVLVIYLINATRYS